MKTITLTDSEAEQIATILSRRANEVAGYSEDHKERYPKVPDKMTMPSSVEYALSLEVTRLRKLADKVNPIQPVQEE